MVAWALLALAFWALVFAVSPESRSYTLAYYYVWLLLFGIPFWIFRHSIESRISRWRARSGTKFFLLALGMVGIEEVLAALFNHLDEGFRFPVFLARLGQFELFNLWVFGGLFLGMYMVLTRIPFSRREAFYLFGIIGLFTERVIGSLVSAPMFFLVTAPIVIFAYGLIIAPALMSLAPVPGVPAHPAKRYAAFLIAVLAVAALFVATIMTVAKSYPWLIPPHTRNF